jgi:hypothetical protein
MKTIIEILNKALPLADGFHIRIENAPYMPLVIEGIGSGPRGQRAISVAHYYSQNGDAMRDPEMCFEVATDSDGSIVELYPYYFLNDGMGIEQQSVNPDGNDSEGKPVYRIDSSMLRDQIAFAVEWDDNIRTQGFEAAFFEMHLANRDHAFSA